MTALRHFCDLRVHDFSSEDTECCKSTVVDCCGTRGVNVAVTGSTGGICTVVSVLVNFNQTDVSVGASVCEVNTISSVGTGDGNVTECHLGVSCVDSVVCARCVCQCTTVEDHVVWSSAA